MNLEDIDPAQFSGKYSTTFLPEEKQKMEKNMNQMKKSAVVHQNGFKILKN